MLTYHNAHVAFRDIPGELSLSVHIGGCRLGCNKCPSRWLIPESGKELNEKALVSLMEGKTRKITCIILHGGDHDKDAVLSLLEFLAKRYVRLFIGWHSFASERPDDKILGVIDYWIAGNPTVGEHYYRIFHGKENEILNIDAIFRNV